MTGLAGRIAALMQLSFKDPRQAARVLLAEDVPLAARTGGTLLMAVLSALLVQPGLALQPPGDDPLGTFLAQSPLQTAVVQWLVLLVTAVLADRVGRAFGGRGNLADALLIVVWLQLIMLAVQVIQLVALLFVPPLAGLIGLGGFVLFLWLATSFVAELHGFASRGAVLAGILLTSFAAAFLIVVVLTLIFGQEALLPNV